MPVMPSFSSFARGPNLVGAASTAKSQVLDAQRVAINAQLQRQQLAQQAEQALMRHQVDLMQLDASRKASESQAQIAQQNIELKKAYDSQRLSFIDRQLAIEEQSAASEMERALMEEELKREYSDLVKTKISAGMDVESAAREAGMQTGWRGWQGLPAAAIPDGMGGSGSGSGQEAFDPEMIPLPGGGSAFRRGEKSFQFIPKEKTTVPMLLPSNSYGGQEYKEVSPDKVKTYFDSLPEKFKTNTINRAAMEFVKDRKEPDTDTSPQNVREVVTPNGRKYKLVIPNAPVSNNR
jgi:hypothetical protein